MADPYIYKTYTLPPSIASEEERIAALSSIPYSALQTSQRMPRTTTPTPAPEIAPPVAAPVAEQPVAGPYKRSVAGGEGYFEWIDARGERHVTETPELAPEHATFKPYSRAIQTIDGGRIYGKATPETVGALERLGRTDAEREQEAVRSLAEATGKPYGEARKAYEKELGDITGRPVGAPQTYEDKIAARNKLNAEVQNLLNEAKTPEERNAILSQAGQFMALHGLDKIEKPEEERRAEAPKTLEAVLAQKYAKGDITLEQFKQAIEEPTQKEESSFWKELGKKSAEATIKSKEDAEEAVRVIDVINEGRRLIDAGIYSGTLANVKTNFNKFLQEFKPTLGGQTAANTETFAANAGKLVGRIIKDFGSGTGLSDADREYAEKIAGGRITLTQDAIIRLLDIADKAQRDIVRIHNEKAAKIKVPAGYPIDLIVEMPKGILGEKGGKPTKSAMDDFEAEYAAMPSGTVFTAPDGTRRRKP